MSSRRAIRWLLFAVASIALTCVLGLKSLVWTSSRPTNLGVRDGKLAPCPASPNCVSSQGPSSHFLDPESLTESSRETIERLKQIIEKMPGGDVIEVRDGYLYAEFTSRWFRFIDDVEIWVNESERQIHFRSASRVGHSDLGVNRERVEAIRRQWKVRHARARTSSS